MLMPVSRAAAGFVVAVTGKEVVVVPEATVVVVVLADGMLPLLWGRSLAVGPPPAA